MKPFNGDFDKYYPRWLARVERAKQRHAELTAGSGLFSPREYVAALRKNARDLAALTKYFRDEFRWWYVAPPQRELTEGEEEKFAAMDRDWLDLTDRLAEDGTEDDECDAIIKDALLNIRCAIWYAADATREAKL